MSPVGVAPVKRKRRRKGMAGSDRTCPQAGGADPVVALAAGASAAEAARQSGLSERTIRRRLEDPTFRAEVTAARAVLLERATGQLAGGATEAVVALRRLLTDKNGAVAVAAARSILSGVVALRQHSELTERIERLEQVVVARRNGSTGPWRPAPPSQESRPTAAGGAE